MAERELRIAIAPGRTGFDAEQGGNGDFHRICYDRLFAYPPIELPNGAMVGDVPNVSGHLAAGWEVSADGRTYRVTLRPGIRSPFGNELTAEDVCWGWQRAFGLRDVGKWVAIIGSVVSEDDVKAVDKYTVEFSLRAPNPTLLQQLTRATPTIYDSREARRHTTESDPWAKDWLGKNPAGFGSYQLAEHTVWKEVVFTANPGARSEPPITAIRYLMVPGRQKRLQMLADGEIDLLTNLDAEDAVFLRGKPGVTVCEAPSGSHVAMMMNCQIAPFDNVVLRRAIATAIPYERIVSEVYGGSAMRWKTALPTTTPMSSDAGWQYDYNPDAARELLRKAGFPNGLKTELFVDSSDAQHLACAAIIIDALNDIGVNVTLETLDPGVFWQGGRYFRPFPMLIWGDRHQVPDPYYGLVHDYDSSRLGLINCGNYRSTAVNGLIHKVENEPDLTKRAALVTEAQRQIMDDAPNAYLAQPNFIAARRDELEGFYFTPDGPLAAEQLYFR